MDQTLPCYWDAFSSLCSNKQNNVPDMVSVQSRLVHRRKMPEWSVQICILVRALLVQVLERETQQFFCSSVQGHFYINDWYQEYRWSEWRLQVFKSDHTQQFMLLPSIFTLINWGCYYCIKIDEVNLSESSLQDVCFKWVSTLEKCTWYVSCSASSLI